MKRLLWIMLLFLALALTYCQQETAVTYLPSKTQLRAGIYNKYYLHYQPDDQSNASIDIAYIEYSCRNDQQQLALTYYDPAYDPSRYQLIQLSDKDWRVLEEEHYFFNGDTSQALYNGNTLYRIGADSSLTQVDIDYPNERHFFEEIELLPPRDTIINEQPGIIFCSQGYRVFTRAEDTTRTEWQREEVWLEGIGLYSRVMHGPNYSFSWELMEQMSADNFRELITDRPNRVAYINPQDALEGPGNFQTCGSINEIYDYYNGDPDGAPAGGKPALRRVIDEHWQSDIFSGLSGYLSLRFVINCEGEIGRFALEQVGLDFQPTTFPTAAVIHCRELIQAIEDWQPMNLWGENRDAYAYITFKLRDGELIELLP